MSPPFIARAVTSSSLRALNYLPEVEELLARREGAVPLGSLARPGKAYGSVFTRLDCDPAHGVELLSQKDMFLAEPRGRVIRADSMAYPDRHRISKWQVLVAAAGTLAPTELYGRCVLADARLEGRYVGPDTLVLNFDEPGSHLNLWTYAYLSTQLGLRILRSTSYGTKVLRFRTDLLSRLPVPLPEQDQLQRVSKLVERSVELREAFARGVSSARECIESTPDMIEARALCAARGPKAIMWDGELPTLSAWTYASAGAALRFLERRCHARLSDVVRAGGIFHGQRFARVLCSKPHGIDFMSQRDVFILKNVPRRIVEPVVPPNGLFATEDMILAGGRGQLNEGTLFGKAELGSVVPHGCGVTEDMLRIVPQDGRRNMLYTFLTTSIGERFFKTAAFGTSIPSVRPDLLLRLPIPDLDGQAVARVDALVDGAYSARLEADRCEAEAVRIFEEEVLPRWLA